MTDESSRAALASRVRGWLPVVIAAGALAIAGFVAIPLGGWDTVQLESEIIPEHPVGETFVGNRVSTSIDGLYLTDAHPDEFSEPGPGETFLVLVATMASETDEPEYPIAGTAFYPFTIPGVLELDVTPELSPSTFLERDGSIGPQAIPGLADTMLFVFTIPDSLFAEGDLVEIGLTDATPEEADIIEGTRWVDVHVAVTVPIAVRDER